MRRKLFTLDQRLLLGAAVMGYRGLLQKSPVLPGGGTNREQAAAGRFGGDAGAAAEALPLADKFALREPELDIQLLGLRLLSRDQRTNGKWSRQHLRSSNSRGAVPTPGWAE